MCSVSQRLFNLSTESAEAAPLRRLRTKRSDYALLLKETICRFQIWLFLFVPESIDRHADPGAGENIQVDLQVAQRLQQVLHTTWVEFLRPTGT